MNRPVVRAWLFRLQEARRALPAGELAGVLACWLVRRVYLVTAKDLHGDLPPAPPIRGVRWTPLRDAHIPLVVATNPTLTALEVRARLARGERCWIGWLGEHPAHWRWEAETDVYLPYLGRTLRPRPGELWVTDVFTHPAYRGRGLYTASTVLALGRARERGFTRMLGMVAEWNRPARHVMCTRAERTVIGAVGYWQIGPWRRYFTRGAIGLAPDDSISVRTEPDARAPDA